MRKLVIIVLLSCLTIAFAVEFEPELHSYSDELDIVFVMDTAGAMCSELVALRNNISIFHDLLETDGTELNVGGMTFGRRVHMWDFNDTLDGFQLTDNIPNFYVKLNSIGCIGEDRPQLSLDAIYSGGFYMENEAGQAPERPRFLFHFTNTSFHYRGDSLGFSDFEFDEVYEAIKAAGIPVFSTTDNYFPISDSQYAELALAGGGRHYNLDFPFTSIFNEMREIIPTYHHFYCEITDLDGLDLDNVALTGLPGVTIANGSVLPIDFLSDSSSIQVGWVLDYACDTSTCHPYTITLTTTDSLEFSYEGEVCFEYVEEKVTDSNKKPTKMNLSAYPNPFNSAVEINFDNASKIEIFDTKGNIVESFDANSSGVMLWHPSEEINSGVFIVRSSSTEGTYTDTKINYIK